MYKNLKPKVFLLFFSFFTSYLFAQTLHSDSLRYYSFDKLKKGYKNFQTDSTKSTHYAMAYLLNAKKIKDTLKIAEGYSFLSLINSYSSYEKGIKYADSVLLITKNLKKNNLHPAFGFKLKGRIFYRIGLYDKALDNYLLALKHTKENPLQKATIKFNIGLLKNNIGEREEAQKIFREHLSFLNSTDIENKNRYLLLTWYALADSYNYTNKLDFASDIINEGIGYTAKVKDSFVYKYFVLSSGINSFKRKNYLDAIDSLKKARKLFPDNGDKESASLCDLYIGKSLIQINKEDRAIYHFKKVDSILEETNDATPEVLEIYNPLIKYYKYKNDFKNQLYFTNRLLKFDSILSNNQRYLAKNISKNYDIKNIVSDKNSLIKKLNRDKSNFLLTSVLLGVVSVFVIIFGFCLIRKNLKYKEKIKSLLQSYNRTIDTRKLIDQNGSESNKVTVSPKIPEKTVKKIIIRLDKFENSKRFLRKNYTLNSLAKELKTNTTYLSKVINITKDCSFANYLNNLKIDAIVERLQNDPKYRSYTIKAISEDGGFNNTNTFTLAFQKKIGLTPIDYLNNLKKQHN